MSKVGKKYAGAKKQVESRPYTVEDAMGLLKKIHYAKFNETIEVHMRLGVDPKHADQMVRGTIVLPHGLGKSKKICVIASGDKIKEAELAEKRRVAPGWLDRDEKILEPVKAGSQTPQPDLLDAHTSDGKSTVTAPAISPNREGEELDRAFGGLNMK